MTRFLFSLVLICALTTAATSTARCQNPSVTSGTNRPVEEIYVAHAVRQTRVAPTVFCNQTRTGFGKPLFEDTFAFRSIETRPSDGRIVRSHVQAIGNMRVCFGVTADSAVLNFYSEGTLSSVPFVGKGECLTVRRDFPERGIRVMRCFLHLQGLPADYVGGHLTSNTVLSRIAVGEASSPAGYTQPSIVTVRLWRRRQ